MATGYETWGDGGRESERICSEWHITILAIYYFCSVYALDGIQQFCMDGMDDMQNIKE